MPNKTTKKNDMQRMKLKTHTLKKGYIQQNITLTKNNIKKYLRPEWHREFRDLHIKTIFFSIANGQHFSEPITVNQKNGKNHILNGNHRIQAVKMLMEKFPDFSIEATVKIYRNLNREEEINIYSVMNKTKRETFLDQMKAQLYDDEIIQKMKKSFPIKPLWRYSSSTDVNSMPYTRLLGPYVSRNNKSFGFQVKTLIQEIKTMNEHDLGRMKKFYTTYRKIFGDAMKDNSYWMSNLVYAISKIYYNNVGYKIDEDQFAKRLTRLRDRSTSQIMALTTTHNYSSAISLYQFVLRQLDPRGNFIDIMDKKNNADEQ